MGVMNWKIGDRAIILRSRVPARIGLVVTIMSEFITRNPATGGLWDQGGGHLIDLPRGNGGLGLACYGPKSLGPIPDANEKTTWDESIFIPKVLERCERIIEGCGETVEKGQTSND